MVRIHALVALLQTWLLVPLQIYTGTINIRFKKRKPTCDVSIGKLIYKILQCFQCWTTAQIGSINIRFAKGNPTCNVSIGRLINSFNVTNVEQIKNLLQYFSSEIFLILTRAGEISWCWSFCKVSIFSCYISFRLWYLCQDLGKYAQVQNQ
jgi:hypothetical protein